MLDYEERKEREQQERIMRLIDLIISCVLICISAIVIPYAFYSLFVHQTYVRSFLLVWAACAGTSAWIYR